MHREFVDQPGYQILADLQKPFILTDLFGNENPVELEIGAGRGDFAVEYARANPQSNLLAVERKLNYLMRGVNKARQREVENIRFFNLEIQHFVEDYLAADSLAAVHIYFPDPWPKKKHKKRRIVQARLVGMLAGKIVPDGYLYLRTDHADYFSQMMEVMGAQTWFVPVETPENVSQFKTGFEKRFVADGLPIYYASYRLVNPPGK